MNRHSLLAAVGILVAASSAQTAPLKVDPLAARGCMQRVSLPDAEAVISRFNLHTEHAKPAEVITLGTSLSWIEKLNDGRPLLEVTQEPKGYTYNYMSSPPRGQSYARQEANSIGILRKGASNYGENQAQVIHELGHLFGNRGGYEAYYRATHGGYCVVSRYSSREAVMPGTVRYHEQFAEVFAAYVTRPGLISSQNTPACKAAFKFFATTVFPRSGELALQCAAHQTNIEKKLSEALVSNAIKVPVGAVHSSLPADIAAAEAKKRADEEAKRAAALAAKNAPKPAATNAAPSNATTNAKPAAKPSNAPKPAAHAANAKPGHPTAQSPKPLHAGPKAKSAPKLKYVVIEPK